MSPLRPGPPQQVAVALPGAAGYLSAMHHMGWGSYIKFDDDQPRPDISRATLRRVLSYAKNYKLEMVIVLVTIIAISVLTVIPPLLMKGLIAITPALAAPVRQLLA